MNHHLNITRIKSVYHSLGELKEKVVFVGGATISLYVDTKTEEIRPTDDIDIVVFEVESQNSFLAKHSLFLIHKTQTQGIPSHCSGRFD